ncbi:MAG: ATP-binding cassette domain-containing protein [Coriobacteriales bacterium]|jgi:ABC-type Fe3+/spermidine/putrescine transport system ATPase subunit|nr:ATP-binding cassette domain-containing protein [Coriobacteriales bacterium]
MAVLIAASMMDKLVVTGVSKRFGSDTVLRDISFTVLDGEFLSILGASGCGKTTLLRIIIGLESQDVGSIHKDGSDISHTHPSKRGMGIVFQNYALFENMTVLRNVEYALLRGGSVDRKKARARALELLERVGLSDQQAKRPQALSGGQQQRVAIARTLVMNPDIILLDEPMSALDVDTRLSLRSELKAIQREFGTTLIYVTHDQEEAFALSDHVMVMHQGVIQQLDVPSALIDQPANDYVRRFVARNIQLKIDSLLPYARDGHRSI